MADALARQGRGLTPGQAPRCAHDWHDQAVRMCWIVWHVPGLSDADRQQSLARLVELRQGDAVLIGHHDARLRGHVLSTTAHRVVVETLDLAVAVVDIAASSLVVI